MKRLIFISFLAVCILLTACGQPVKKATVTAEGFLDPETGIEYVECDPLKLYPYLPYDSTEDQDDKPDVFLTVTRNGNTRKYYGVFFESTDDFLCYEYGGYYYLVRNKNLKEPTLQEFKPIAAHIYDSTDTNYISSFYASNEYLPQDKQNLSFTQDSWLCLLMAEHLDKGEAVYINADDSQISDLYYFHLFSQQYEGIYYRIAFFKYNGRYFLRDSGANKTVYCPREVILRMVGEE